MPDVRYPIPGRSARVAVAAAGATMNCGLWLGWMMVLQIAGWLVGLSLVIADLYLVKSALGIDLFPGHSPLHDLLYSLVRR